MERVMQSRAMVRGTAEGQLLVSSEPLSFWGGIDYVSGEVIDRRHPLSGQIVTGRILAVPFSRGSSTTTAVLLEAIHAQTAPAAILTTHDDTFFALASIVADEMYRRPIPIALLNDVDFSSLVSGAWARVGENGQVTIRA